MELRVKYVLGADLREERDRRNLTQKEAAEQAGVAVRTWQLWELGEVTPRAKHRRALINWLNPDEVAA